MQRDTLLRWLYLVNASVLISHEIESAYWHEWELLGIPGDVQVFVILNLILVIAVLYGLWRLVEGQRSGIIFSWGLALSGLFAVVVHGYFLIQGDQAFRLPLSFGLLLATLLLSMAQILVLLRIFGRT